MSDAGSVEEPAIRGVDVKRLRDRTLDELTAELWFCDSCGDEQLFGCTIGVRLGWDYRELCADCETKLRAALALADSPPPETPETPA